MSLGLLVPGSRHPQGDPSGQAPTQARERRLHGKWQPGTRRLRQHGRRGVVRQQKPSGTNSKLSSANLNDNSTKITFFKGLLSLSSSFELIAGRKQLPASADRYSAALMRLEARKRFLSSSVSSF